MKRAGEGIVRAGYGNKKGRKATIKDKTMKTNGIFNAASSLN